MPDDRLKSFGMRSDPVRMPHRNEHADIGDSGCVATIAADHADDRGSNRLRVVERGHDIGTHIRLDTSATH